MRKVCLLLIMLLLSLSGTKALCNHRIKHPPIGKPVHPKPLLILDPDPEGDFQTITVPIKRAGTLIIVEAQLDTMIGNFILDTGAPGLVLNETYFRDLPHDSEKDAGGITGAAHAFTTTVHNLDILDLHYSRLTADVTDLSRIENTKGVKVLGLLGTRLFSKLAITVDLFNNVLYIHKPDEKGDITTAERVFDHPDMKTDFKLLNDVMFIKGSINESEMWFAFDTGAECNLLDHENFKKLARKMRVVSQQTLTGVGGTKYENAYAVFDNLVVGNYLFKHNRIMFTRLEEMGKAYNNTVDAILGHDFFARGIFTINFVKKEFEMYIYTYPDK
jgi:hypothetical protein